LAVEEAGISVGRESAVDSVIEFRTDFVGEFLRGVDGNRRIEAAGVARRKPERRRKRRTWSEREERRKRSEAWIQLQRQD
jgi:ABC-type proline/glycine betaine transport system ATPase subunit